MAMPAYAMPRMKHLMMTFCVAAEHVAFGGRGFVERVVFHSEIVISVL